MRVRARPSLGRSILITASLVLAAAPPVLGAGGTAPTQIPEPREMVRGETSGYRLPFKAGMEVQVVQGWNTSYSHSGRSQYAYDFGLYLGTPVTAAASGVVAFTHSGETRCGGPELKASANLVTINHPDGSATSYGHLGKVDVQVGDVVEAGQVIATSGQTGFTECRPHLHFARQLQGEPVTDSIPVYFQGYEDQEFRSGDLLEAAQTCEYRLAKATEAETATNTFCSAYFRGTFEGSAIVVGNTDLLDIDRDSGGAGGYWLDGVDAYSARWMGRFEFDPGWYSLRIDATGGIRVTLDGVAIVDDWFDREDRQEIDLRVRMREGVHVLEVEHFSTRAVDRLSVDWSLLPIDESDRRPGFRL